MNLELRSDIISTEKNPITSTFCSTPLAGGLTYLGLSKLIVMTGYYMRHIEPEVSLNKLNILHSCVAFRASTVIYI